MKKLMYRFNCFLMSMLIGVSSLLAEPVNLTLTKGTRVPIPVAVVPFKGSVLDEGAPDDVISSDLKHSGRFAVADPSAFTSTPSNFSEVDLPYWQGQRLNAIVVGSVTLLSGDRYQIDYQLINVFQPTSSGATDKSPSSVPSQTVLTENSSPILLSDRLIVSAKNIRSASHEIADRVYTALTGDPGFFKTKLAYVTMQQNPANESRRFQLMISDYDGFNSRILLTSANPIMSPAWSYDGKQLAFVGFDNNAKPAIYTINPKTAQYHLISQVTGLNAAPTFSVSGDRLALVLSQSGAPKIYTLNLNTKATTSLTTGFSADTEPVFSHDNASLFYTSNQTGVPQIYRYDFANRASSQITTAGSYNSTPELTSDDQTLVMLHGDENGYNIATQDLASNQMQLVTDMGKVSGFSLGPDDNLLLYTAYNKGRSYLAATSLDHSVNYILPASSGVDIREPAWQRVEVVNE